MKNILCRALTALCAILALFLVISCASTGAEKPKEPEKKSDKKEDRFAFLHDKERPSRQENAESTESEKVIPRQDPKNVITPEQMKQLTTTAPEKIPAESLNKEAPKFYEDYIALNGDEEVEVSLLFNSAQLIDVLSAFSDILGFNFVADNELKGVVTLNLNSKMSRKDLWITFEKMLFLAGATAKKDGSILRVMPINKSIRDSDSRPGKDGDFEIYYRELRNVSANQVVNQAKQFLSAGATCVALNEQNAIMFCDTAENMPKLRELVEYFDKTGKENWPRTIIPCNNILPSKVALELQEILPVLGLKIHKSWGNDSPGAVYLIGLNRMQLVVASAATQEALDLIREWVHLLDTAGADDQENVFVYKVRHNKAAHLARALSVIFEMQGTALTTDTTTGKTKLETINSPAVKTIRSTVTGSTPSTSVNSGSNMETDQESKVFNTPIRVFADGVLNRLIVRCTPRTYASVKALMDKLDVVPAQVLLQVLMVQVTLTDSTQFGLEFSGQIGDATFGTNYNETTPGSLLNPFILDESTKEYRPRQGSERQSGGTIMIANPNDPQNKFGYLRAQAGDGEIKVISSPQLLVSSHTQAKIQVGQDVPIITGGITNSQSSANVTSTYEYKETGVMLTVTPYVTSTDLISLEIEQTMSQAITNTITPKIESPVVDKQMVSTSMTIANGQTMVLGGLIQERANDSLSTVPGISQIPYIKRLLGSTDASVTRTELLVMVTGWIVDEQSDVEKLIRRYDDAVNALNKFDRGLGDKPDAKKNRPVLFGDKDFWK